MHIWLIKKYHCLLKRNQRNVEIDGTTTYMAKYSKSLLSSLTAMREKDMVC